MIYPILFGAALAFSLFFYSFWTGVLLFRHRQIFYERELSIGSPLVTVIMPAYNKAAYIGKAIEAVEASDYPKKEIIVVEDCSTDGTREILERFGDRIKLVKRDQRGGKASALNLGSSIASGEVLVMLDADTIVERDCITKLVAHLREEGVGAVTPFLRISSPKRIIELVQLV